MIKTYLAVAVIITLGLIGYGLISARSRERLVKLEIERAEKERRISVLDCKTKLEEDLHLSWVGECMVRGQSTGCELSESAASKLFLNSLDSCMEI